MEKSHNKNIFEYIIYFILFIYIIVLLKIILFKYSGPIEILKGHGIKFRTLNLIPFKMWVDLINTCKTMSTLWAIANSFGNLIVFIPLGYLLPLIFRKKGNMALVSTITFLFSLTLESLQYILAIGSADIDDIILNTLGGIIGYLIYKGIRNILKTEKKVYIATIILAVLFCFSGFLIAKEEFGNLLGITKFSEEVIGGEEIPKDKANYGGTFINYDSDNILMYKGMVSDKNADTSLMEQLKIQVNANTKVYLNTLETKENKMTIKYEKFKDPLSSIEKNSTLFIWGKEVDGKIIADIITIQKPQFIDNKAGDIALKTSDDSINTGTKDEVEIPKEKETVQGDFKERQDNVIIVDRRDVIVDNAYNAYNAYGTDIKVKIKVHDKTQFILKIITQAGQRKSIEVASLEDIKDGDMIHAWGEIGEGEVIANTVVISRIEK